MRPTANRFPMRRCALATAVSLCFSGTALANPQGPTVVSGSASFASSGRTLTVTNSPGAIIDWQRFSIDSGEVTRFLQQSSTSAVLNRVSGGDPSLILGMLQSNGRVFLVNPNGITFGEGAQVDVGGLVVSTLNLSDSDFLAGRLNFSVQEGAAGIRNEGRIRSGDGGQILLIAPNVENLGLISAPNGDLLLAAGKSVRLVDINNPEVQVELSAPSNAAVNLGTLAARNVGLFGGVIRHTGTISADTVEVDDHGRIVFRAAGEMLIDGGLLSATNSAGRGGYVELTGERVILNGAATVNASGVGGGGEILVGGDFQGGNPDVPNARGTWLGRDAELRADATGQGHGGKVIVWSDDVTHAYGTISARGSGSGGDGGLVETSGHYLSTGGVRVDAGASAGKVGTWLLDPWNLTVIGTPATVNAGTTPNFEATATGATVYAGDIVAGLSTNDVRVTTGSSGAEAGIITVNAPISWSTAYGLSIMAAGDLVLNAAITAGSAVPINLVSGWNGSVSTPAATGGGGISLNANVATLGDVTLSAGSSGINMAAASGISAANLQVTSNGTVSLNGANSVGSVTANLYGGSGSFLFSNNTSLTVWPVVTNGGAINVHSVGGSVQVGSALRSYGGDISLSSASSYGGVSFGSTGSAQAGIGNVNIRADTLGLSSPSTIGGYDVSIQPFSSSRSVCIDISVGCVNALNISPNALGQITAGNLLILGWPVADPSYTGTLTVKGASGTTLTDSNVHASKLALNGRNVTVESGASIGTSATPLNTNVDVLANENVSVGGNVYLGAGKNLFISAGGNPSGVLDLGNAVLSANNISLVVPMAGSIIQGASGQVYAAGTLDAMVPGAANISVTGSAGLFQAKTSGGTISYATSGPANLGLLDAGTGSVSVSATTIEDGNGGGAANIKAAAATLTANGSVDVDTQVGSLSLANGAASGAVVVRNSGSALLASVIGNSTVTVTNDNSIDASDISGSGPVSVTASGAASDINVGMLSSISGPDVTLNAGQDVNVAGGSVMATAGSVDITAGRNINVSGVTGSGGSIIAALDVFLTATAGKLFLTSGGSDARIVATTPMTVYLNVPSMGSGGYVIDGVEGGATTSAVNPNTGIFVGSTGNPAVVGTSFLISYGLPTLTECIANPTLTGCSSVLPSLTTCLSAPTTPGCEVVLPSLATCISAPATPGCTAVLPSLTTCLSAPTTPGCSVVLPSLATCISAPATPGCSVVLPSISQCVASPTLPGCTVVLPPLSICISAPATPGCSVVLPSISQCVANPALTGCLVVLPTLAQCIASPTLMGCSVVLPTLTQCIASPTLMGCSVVLPTLAQCVIDQALAGCSVVLPTLSQCIADSALPGCSVVLPTAAECMANPMQLGCPATDPALIAARNTNLLQDDLQPQGDGSPDDRRRRRGTGGDSGPPPGEIRNLRQLPVCR